MWVFKHPVTCVALLLLAGAGGLGGCAYYNPTPVVAQTGQAGQRVYTYPNGRYELHGNGTAADPYYWAWIPTGTESAVNPPPPPFPSSSSAVVAAPPDKRVYTYANGRYELHGEGTADNPFYWVWTPAPTAGQAMSIPPAPPLPPQS